MTGRGVRQLWSAGGDGLGKDQGSLRLQQGGDVSAAWGGMARGAEESAPPHPPYLPLPLPPPHQANWE